MQRSSHRLVHWALAALLAGSACSSSTSTPPAGSPSLAGWWQDRVFYEVFVRSFADSDGDGIGDLRGLTAHLDDLNDGDFATTTDLGVGALWLMPIFPSPSYHGYDVTNYRDVNPQYGTLADLDALVSAAHARGLKVILDMVPNHSSDRHPWFQDARTGPSATKRDWYVWSSTAQPGPWYQTASDSWYYALFSSSMPDLNYRTAAVEAEIIDTMRFWLARGVDGFRLDAVRHLVENGLDRNDQPETHQVLRRMRAALQGEYPDVLLVGEAWTNVETVATYWGSGDELQLAFSFDLADALKQAAAGGDAGPVINVLARTEVALAGKDRRFEAPFLSNHDQDRVMRAVAGDAAAARVAASTLFALPGTPFVYYGEELGMQGGTSDPDRRTPFRWTPAAPGYGFTTGVPWRSYAEAAGVDLASARADPASLWHLYRRLIAVRHGAPALSSAEAARVGVSGGGAGVLALVRGSGSARVLFVANFAAAPTGPFAVSVSAAAATVLADEGLVATPAAAPGGPLTFQGLGARSWAFLSLL